MSIKCDKYGMKDGRWIILIKCEAEEYPKDWCSTLPNARRPSPCRLSIYEALNM